MRKLLRTSRCNRQDAKNARGWAMKREPDAESDKLAHEVIGAAIEVHRVLGPGYLERTYERAMAIELGLRGIPYERQSRIDLEYKGHSVGQGRTDFLVGERVIAEFKSVDALAPIHFAQVLSYLRALKLPLGLLINFNVPVLRDGIKRVVLTELGSIAATRRDTKGFRRA